MVTCHKRQHRREVPSRPTREWLGWSLGSRAESPNDSYYSDLQAGSAEDSAVPRLRPWSADRQCWPPAQIQTQAGLPLPTSGDLWAPVSCSQQPEEEEEQARGASAREVQVEEAEAHCLPPSASSHAPGATTGGTIMVGAPTLAAPSGGGRECQEAAAASVPGTTTMATPPGGG